MSLASAAAHRALHTAGERSPRPVAIWLLACCAMIVAMVVIGGITRLTWSGLSITEWQPVTGVLPPLSSAGWAAEFEKYRQIPQYRLVNAGMTLAEFKTIYLWEYVHRLWGRLIGVVYLLPFLYFLARRRIPHRLAWPLAGIFALGAAQGLLGWWMVESGLADRIEVSQYRLTAHLALALLIYGLTLWTALGLLASPPPATRKSGERDGAARRQEEGAGGGAVSIGSPHPALSPRPAAAAGKTPATAPKRLRRGAEIVLALVGLTIVAGGFVAGLNAGLIYNTFPLMGDRLVPGDYATLAPFVRNWFENPAAAQFDHRILAMTTAAAVIALWLAGHRAALPRPARIALHALLGAVTLQFALGLSTLLLVVPIALAAAHQAGAVLLLTAAIVLRHALRPAERPAALDGSAAAGL